MDCLQVNNINMIMEALCVGAFFICMAQQLVLADKVTPQFRNFADCNG